MPDLLTGPREDVVPYRLDNGEMIYVRPAVRLDPNPEFDLWVTIVLVWARLFSVAG